MDVVERARERFVALYGETPATVVFAPGRVNLIGQHTEYSHLPAMPFAIERGLAIAVSATDQPVVNAQSEAFPGVIEVTRADPRAYGPWAHHLTGVLHELAGVAPARGARIAVESDLPATGGLASSTALTLGLLAGLSQAWDAPLEGHALVTAAMRGERHTGIETAGTDQQTILFAEAEAVLRIDFEPPERRAIAVGEGAVVIIADSGERTAEGQEAKDAYNERVIGARLAAAMLADQVGVPASHPPRLRDVIDVDVVELLADDLPERITPREVAHGVDADVSLLTTLASDRWDARAKVPVRRIALHGLAEAERVNAAEAAIAAGDWRQLGVLLDASHNSLRENMRCSTPALDRLCAAMRKAGAFGARLTGAGFGGYAIAVAPPEAEAAVIAAAEEATGGPAFRVTPSNGLRVL